MTWRPTRRFSATLFLFAALFCICAAAQELRKGSSGSGDDDWRPPAPPVKRNHPVGRKPAQNANARNTRPVNPSVSRTTPTPKSIPTTTTSTTTVASVDDERVDSAIEKGNAALEAGRLQNAEDFYKSAAELDPTDWRAYMGLGNLYWDYGRRFDADKREGKKVSLLALRYDDAVKAYQKAAELNPDEPAIFVALAFIYNDGFSNRESQAIEAANAALKLQPNFPEAHYNLGNAYLNTERYPEAIASFKETIRLKPRYAKAYRLLGITYVQLKRYDEAIAAYKQGIQIVPTFNQTYLSLSSLYVDLKRYEESLGVLRQLALVKPTDHEPFQELGRLLIQLSRNDEAVVALKDAVRLNNNPKSNKYPHVYLAEAYINLRKYDDAIATLNDIIRIGPNVSVSSEYDRLAFAYNQSERYAEAIEAAQQSIKKHDDSPSPFNSLAFSYNQLGRYDEAITAAKRALALNPKFGNPHSHIAFAYLKTGRLNEALAEAKQAIELAPRYARAHYTIGLIYVALRDKAKALESQKTLVSLDPKLGQKLLEEINR